LAFPTVVGSNATSNTSPNNPNHTVTLPGSIAAGDLLIALVAVDGAPTWTWPGDWNELLDQAISAQNGITVGYKIAAGGETTVVPVSSFGERSNHISLRISAASWHGTTPPEITTPAATGSGTNANPAGSPTASWGSDDNLFIAVCSIDTNGGPVTGWPANYSGNQLQNNTASSAGIAGLATRELAADSDDPGTFTNGSDNWLATTLIVRPAAGGAPATSLPFTRRQMPVLSYS
jgi:hypothetical protein